MALEGTPKKDAHSHDHQFIIQPSSARPDGFSSGRHALGSVRRNAHRLPRPRRRRARAGRAPVRRRERARRTRPRPPPAEATRAAGRRARKGGFHVDFGHQEGVCATSGRGAERDSYTSSGHDSRDRWDLPITGHSEDGH